MLKDRGEPVAPWQCRMKYAPGAWNCDAQNSVIIPCPSLHIGVL